MNDRAPLTPRPFTGEIGDIDLRLLRVFMAVADHGGFAAAEVALGKNKSARPSRGFPPPGGRKSST